MQRFRELSAAGRFGRPLTWCDDVVVFSRGENATSVWFLEHGAVEIVQCSELGESIVVKVLVGPTLFGVIEAMSNEPTYLETVKTLGGVRAYQLSHDEFLGLVAQDPLVGTEVSTDLCLAFRSAAMFESSRLYDADILLANLLVSYAQLFGSTVADGVQVNLRRTQAQLAAAVGASERQVSRLIAEWKKSGRIDKRDGLLVLRDIAFFNGVSVALQGSLVHRYQPIRRRATVR